MSDWPKIYEDDASVTSAENGAGSSEETSVAPLLVGVVLSGVVLAVAYMARDKALTHGQEHCDCPLRPRHEPPKAPQVFRRNVELTFLDGRPATKASVKAEAERQALNAPTPGSIERSAASLALTRGFSPLRTWAVHDELDRQDREYRRRGGDPSKKIPTLGQMPIVGEIERPIVHPRVEVVNLSPRIKSPQTLLAQIRERKNY